jgi:hypothetical protein
VRTPPYVHWLRLYRWPPLSIRVIPEQKRGLMSTFERRRPKLATVTTRRPLAAGLSCDPLEHNALDPGRGRCGVCRSGDGPDLHGAVRPPVGLQHRERGPAHDPAVSGHAGGPAPVDSHWLRTDLWFVPAGRRPFGGPAGPAPPPPGSSPAGSSLSTWVGRPCSWSTRPSSPSCCCLCVGSRGRGRRAASASTSLALC